MGGPGESRGIGGAERLQERPPPETPSPEDPADPRQTPRTRAGAPRTVWAQRGEKGLAAGHQAEASWGPGPRSTHRDARPAPPPRAQPRGLASPRPRPPSPGCVPPRPRPRGTFTDGNSRTRPRASPNFLQPSEPRWGVCPRARPAAAPESPAFVWWSPPPGPPPQVPNPPPRQDLAAVATGPGPGTRWALGGHRPKPAWDPWPGAGRLPGGAAGILAALVRVPLLRVPTPCPARPGRSSQHTGPHAPWDRSALPGGLGPGASYPRAADVRPVPRAPRRFN